VVGGDGTLVRTLKNYYDKPVRIICVNTGNVGFYSKFTNKDIEKFDDLITKNSNYIKPCILEITSNSKTTYAINEVVIQSLNTVETDIEIDNIFYERFKGTGILVCTKTGSTAQAKTNNGAIIAPNVNAIQLVELAPTIHANKTTITSPLILDDKTKIKLSYFKFNQRTDVITDGMLR
jgi:NAD+ kinase